MISCPVFTIPLWRMSSSVMRRRTHIERQRSRKPWWAGNLGVARTRVPSAKPRCRRNQEPTLSRQVCVDTVVTSFRPLDVGAGSGESALRAAAHASRCTKAQRCGETAWGCRLSDHIDADVDYCSRVAVRVPQTCASTFPAASTTSAVWELENSVPAALSWIVAETLSNVPSGVPSGAPNGV